MTKKLSPRQRKEAFYAGLRAVAMMWHKNVCVLLEDDVAWERCPDSHQRSDIDKASKLIEAFLREGDIKASKFLS